MKLPKSFTKYASAPSLSEISKSIAKFYGGEEKEIREKCNGEYTVHSKKDGRTLSTMVLASNGRYYFGTPS